MNKFSYLKVGRADELKSPIERSLYRAFEILPGALAWTTLLGVIFFSWYKPVWVAFFIIAFDVYWLLKTLYLSLHLRSSYNKMKQNMKVDWMKKLRSEKPQWKEYYHLLILPTYKESSETVRETFNAIVNSDYPKDKMIAVLAVEERAGEEAREMSRIIEEEFGGYFYKFLTTIHPDGIKGELAGKGANSTWAAREAKEKIIEAEGFNWEKVIVSCFDIDTRVYSRYFSCLTYHYLDVENPVLCAFQPVPVYNNNIWNSPAISRVVATSGTFWQMMQQQRPERLSTFSSQSHSFKALAEADFWPVNVVSEDSRVFWQNLLYYGEEYRAIPLHYPVSMDANLASGFWKTALNIYKQQRRWGWGVENLPYVLFGFWKDSREKRKKIGLKQKIHWSWVQLEGFWSWATNAVLIFLLGWLPLMLGGDEFNATILAYHLPRVTRFLMTLAMLGLVSSAIYSTLLLPRRPKGFGAIRQLGMVVQWILIPFTILVFGSIPGIEAQTRLMLGKYMGFWVTPKEKNEKQASSA
jgi:cellulose synthase/poly-beta-1,6-N-acetylglucosamine synthase-like glycosyltransferase